MQMTPDQLAQLQAMVAQRAPAPQGAIQQAQGAPMMPQGMPPQGDPQMKQAMLQKFMALPPASKEKFLAAVKAQKQQK